MTHLIYDVSVSVDGYIAGSGDDISRFPGDGDMVDDYFKRLSEYSICLMGRRTYEFGYQFGLKPGDNPYPSMRSIVLSRSISIPDQCSVELVRNNTLDFVRSLKKNQTGDIYLCGGGELAGSLARAGLIDELRLKRPAIVLGGGTPLFGRQGADLTLKPVSEVKQYSGGRTFQKFTVGSHPE